MTGLANRIKFLLLTTCVLLPLYVSRVFASDAAPTPSASAEKVEFNDQFLYPSATGEKLNVSRFANGNPVLPGVYSLTIYINNVAEYSGNVEFKDNGSDIASPCITGQLLHVMSFNTDKLESENGKGDLAADTKTCYDIKTRFPGTQMYFDSAEQRLDITLPQIYVSKRPRGYIDPSLWDSGINAAMLSYDFNAYSSEDDGDSSQSVYAGLNYGINLGAWHLRSRGTAQWTSDDGADYDHQDLYLQHDITALKSQLVLGDTYTDGDTFDSISLRGVRLYSDDRMKPGSMSGYAPVVRGVAKSNAKVTIRQNGNTIYENTVPPGPFAITDLNPTGYGTDLDVTVTEADGSESSFSVPFSSVTQLLRPGDTRWDIGIGELNDDSTIEKTRVATATGYYGLNNLFTGYAGFEFTDTDYYAGLLGLALNTGVGAFAFDVTHSHAEVGDRDALEGQSYRLTYSKLLELTDTSLNVAAYRFSTKEYLSLQDAASFDYDYHHDSENEGDPQDERYEREKNEIQVNISQPLRVGEKDYGSVYLTGSWEDYWGSDETTSQYSFGYSDSFRWGSYNISLQRTYDEEGDEDDRLYVSLSIPLNNLFGHDSSLSGFNTLNSSVSSDFKGTSQSDISVSGNTADNKYSYSVNASSSMSDNSDLNQIGGYGSYNGPWGPVSASVSVNDDHGQQYSFANSGGIVLHSGGLTLIPGNPGINSTVALINAPGAKGAKTNNGDGEIDSRGYAVIPWLTPYHENTIGLNIDSLENDVEMKNTSATSVPRDGAIVLVNFETDEGRSVLLELLRSDKGFIPLGADVYNSKNVLVGSVGQAGRAYVRGIDDSDVLSVRWGSKSEDECLVSYSIPPEPQKVGMTIKLPKQICKVR